MPTLQEALVQHSNVEVLKDGNKVIMIVENVVGAWVYTIVGNKAELIKHHDKFADPIFDIRNSLEPEDFK